MDILQIAGIAIVAVITIAILKQSRPELALVLGIGAGTVILIMILDSLFEVIYTFYGLAESASMDSGLFKSVLKIVGVGYISEFTSSICIDAGNKSVADKVMLAGKVGIMLLALPIIKSLVSVVAQIVP